MSVLAVSSFYRFTHCVGFLSIDKEQFGKSIVPVFGKRQHFRHCVSGGYMQSYNLYFSPRGKPALCITPLLWICRAAVERSFWGI